MTGQDECLLLSLPLEIRLLIFTHHYKDIAVLVKPPGQACDTPPQAMALMQTNRQISAEASPLFYDNATFWLAVKAPCYRCKTGDKITPDGCCFVQAHGLRHLHMPVMALETAGCNSHYLKKSTFHTPFRQVRHIYVEIDIVFWYDCSVDQLRDVIRVLQNSFQLSCSITRGDSGFSYCTELEIIDFEQPSTWRLWGDNSIPDYKYFRDFLQAWGLSWTQTKSIFSSSDIEWCLPHSGSFRSTNAYEQIGREYQEISEEAGRTRDRDMSNDRRRAQTPPSLTYYHDDHHFCGHAHPE